MNKNKANFMKNIALIGTIFSIIGLVMGSLTGSYILVILNGFAGYLNSSGYFRWKEIVKNLE